MAGKAQNSSAHGVLILIIPIALAIVLLFLAWPVLLTLVVVGGIGSVWQRYQWLKWCRQINPIFHQLIHANQGSITALDLAIKANISGEQAKRYLDAKAEEFAAQTYDHEDQGIVYSFITGNILGRILDDSEPVTEPKVEAQQELAETPPEVKPQSTLTQEAAEKPEEPPPQQQPTQVVAEKLEASPPPKPPVFETFDDDYWAAKPEEPPPQTQLVESEAAKLEEPPPQVEPQQSTPTPAAEPSEVSLSEEEETLEEPIPQGQKPPAESLPKTHPILQSLIQSELARRLDVHSSTVYKRRNDPDFAQWTRSRDPEGIAWEFSEDTKEFYPLETES